MGTRDDEYDYLFKGKFQSKICSLNGHLNIARPLIELNCCYWVEEGRGGLIRLSWTEIWQFFATDLSDISYDWGG